MPLRITWPGRERRNNKPGSDPLHAFRQEAGTLRKQGELPGKDGESYSRYLCDLCHRSRPLTELRQCIVCGRWACSTCWTEKYYICNSCNGILSLHQICETDSEEEGTDGGEGSAVPTPDE